MGIFGKSSEKKSKKGKEEPQKNPQEDNKKEKGKKEKKDRVKELEKLISGKGASDKILDIVKELNNNERLRVLMDPSRMTKLLKALDDKAKTEVMDHLNLNFKQRLSLALMVKDSSLTSTLIKEASKKDLAEVADDVKTIKKIGKLSKTTRNQLFDMLVDVSTTAEAIQVMIEARFKLKIGSHNKRKALKFLQTVANGVEDSFGPNGLRRIYHVLRRLPEKHVKKLKYITTDNKASGGAASGVAMASSKAVNITYDESKTDDVESGAYTHAKDKMRGMNTLDTTAAHEISHVVDKNQKYSGKDSFRKLSNWKHYPSGGDAAIVKAIKDNMAKPLKTEVTAEEKKISDKAAELGVINRLGDTSQMTDVLDVAYDELSLKKDGDGAKYRSAADMETELVGSNLHEHIGRGKADNSPWYKEAYDYLKPQQIHEAYAGRGWFAYDNDARKNKLSIYQFRDPGEEFAELYATYHMSTPKGKKVDDKRKKWLEAEGLHED